MPTVSVVIPVYNAASFIEPTLQSVLNQSYQDFEVIVVDDGSTDETAEVLSAYHDTIQYVYRANGGQSSARNTGIKAATGIYIALLDHDDLWTRDKLALQVSAIEEVAARGLVTCGSERFNEEGVLNVEIPRLNELSRQQVRKQLLMGNFIGSCSKALMKKECFEKIGLFDESLHMAEDWDMWFRIAGCYDIYCVEKLLVRYRIHERNFSAHSGEINLINEIRFMNELFAREEVRCPPLLRGRAFAKRYVAAAWALLQENEIGQSRLYMQKALTHYPPLLLQRSFLGLLRAVYSDKRGT